MDINKRDLHDYKDVAENYDSYVEVLVNNTGLNNKACVSFHLELADKYGEGGVADLGCGTGLVLIPLLREGFKVYGVDISEEMINITEAKVKEDFGHSDNCKLICSDMTNFKLNKKVSLVVIPRSGFLHLLKTSEQINTLKNINASLCLGGMLSLNSYYPSYEIIAQNGKNKVKEPFLRSHFINSKGNKEEIYNLMNYDFETQIVDGKWIFKELDSHGEVIEVRARPLKMRWTFRSEMELLFELCGFEVVEIFGGYDKSEAAYPGNIIWVVRKVREI
jgi:SAM-dependent methyltransferase